MHSLQNLTQFGSPVRACVERALDSAGFSHLPFSERADAAAALTAEAYGRIGLSLAAVLDERSLAEFRRLADLGAADDEVAAFFRVRVPDLEERLQKALADLESEVARAADEARQASHLRQGFGGQARL